MGSLTHGDTYSTNNFGHLIIIRDLGYKNVLVEFVETKFRCVANRDNVINGRVKDKLKPNVHGTGFIGDGKHKSTSNINATYCWHSMLERCYCDKFKVKNKTYIGCSVCKEWHNFQTFCDWYEKNYPQDGLSYQLDKDIKIKGNRVYSPSTCMFVTCKENTIAARAKSYSFLSPQGEVINIYNLSDFCRRHDLQVSKMAAVNNNRRSHHKGWKAKQMSAV